MARRIGAGCEAGRVDLAAGQGCGARLSPDDPHRSCSSIPRAQSAASLHAVLAEAWTRLSGRIVGRPPAGGPAGRDDLVWRATPGRATDIMGQRGVGPRESCVLPCHDRAVNDGAPFRVGRAVSRLPDACRRWKAGYQVWTRPSRGHQAEEIDC